MITFKTNYQSLLPNECPSTYILFPAKLKGEVRPFWNGKTQTYSLSHELFLTCWDNVNYYKSVHQPIPARENWEHPGNFQSEPVSSAFNEFCHFTL